MDSPQQHSELDIVAVYRVATNDNLRTVVLYGDGGRKHGDMDRNISVQGPGA